MKRECRGNGAGSALQHQRLVGAQGPAGGGVRVVAQQDGGVLPAAGQGGGGVVGGQVAEDEQFALAVPPAVGQQVGVLPVQKFDAARLDDLALFAQGVREDGQMPLCAPSGKETDYPIPFFSLMYIAAVYEYCKHTGDLSLGNGRFSLDDGTRPLVVLTDAERAAIHDLKSYIEQWLDSSDEKTFANYIYKAAEDNGVDKGDFFTAVYKVLIGKERGPKLAGFLKACSTPRLVSILSRY